MFQIRYIFILLSISEKVIIINVFWGNTNKKDNEISSQRSENGLHKKAQKQILAEM